jgi:hypothetical protein
VGPASLPASAGERRGDRVDQPGVGIGDAQPDTGEPSRDQAAKQRAPAGPVLGVCRSRPRISRFAGGVHAPCDHHRDVGDPAALADLVGEHVEPDVRLGTTVQRSATEGLDRCRAPCPSARPGLRDPLDPEVAHQAFDAPRRDAPDVGPADDLDERWLRASARLEQPIGEVAALAELGDGQVDRGRFGCPMVGPDTRCAGSLARRERSKIPDR